LIYLTSSHTSLETKEEEEEEEEEEDKMDPSLVKIPPLRDLTIDNITENVILINSLCEDARMKYVLERLVTHLHDFARETRLSFDEWMAGIKFLTETGQICTDVRQVSTPPSQPPF
jgi:membrane-anchored protein YejM (alkaline phosphatase superfamily)